MESPVEPLDREGDPLLSLAKKQFGIEYLFPLQRMAMAAVFDAVDAGNGAGGAEDAAFRQLVLFPTGFGKSLCFQLPALFLPGITLIIYPLLALMNDQKRSLDRRGIPSCLFRGGMDEGERQKAFASLESGASKIVITNPESLAGQRLRSFLASQGVFHLAIDEAHCVSEWGETFRPSYLDLGTHIAALAPKVISAFTATASPTVAEAIARHLFGGEPYRLITADMDKPNIRYSVEPTMSPLHTLTRLVKEKEKPLLVFDQSRSGVRHLCEEISGRTGMPVKFYHAGLARGEKEAVERWFMESDVGILTATCAYGMGVDKRNIRTVIHFSPPASVEAYLQEAGRGGRDGGPAEAVLLHTWSGRTQPLAECGKPGTSETQAEALRERRKESFLGYAQGAGCGREALLRLMGSEMDSPCAGCDHCEGIRRSVPEGLDELMEFFALNDGRFIRGQASALLAMNPSGGHPPGGMRREPPACAGAGLLADWEHKDIEELYGRAVRQGYLEPIKGYFRKGRIRILDRNFFSPHPVS